LLPDAFPVLGISPFGYNLTFTLTTVAFVLSGVVLAIEMHLSERARRREVEESRERLDDFARSSSDSFFEATPDGRVTFANGPTAQMAGLAEGGLAAAFAASETARASLVRALAGRDAFRLNGAVSGVQGRLRTLELRGRPKLDAAGEVIAWRGTVTDVSDDLQRAADDAQRQKHAALGQLAGGVAHEINNLLHPIINLARRSAQGLEAADERRRWLDVVVESGRRAAEIVGTLLATVRRGPDIVEVAPLEDAVRRSFETVRSVAPGGIHLSLEADGTRGPDLPVHEVFEVVANLTSNAVYALSGGGTVTVRLTGDGAGGVLLCVADNGAGMDAATLARAREPFYTTKDVGQGTGLGLHLVSQLAQKWGATFDLESAVGQGTRATIRLPVRKAEAA
jgi:signal transduction histidine kinase